MTSNICKIDKCTSKSHKRIYTDFGIVLTNENFFLSRFSSPFILNSIFMSVYRLKTWKPFHWLIWFLQTIGLSLSIPTLNSNGNKKSFDTYVHHDEIWLMPLKTSQLMLWNIEIMLKSCQKQQTIFNKSGDNIPDLKLFMSKL